MKIFFSCRRFKRNSALFNCTKISRLLAIAFVSVTATICSESFGLCTAAQNNASPFAGGTGSRSAPFIICTYAQLQNVRNYGSAAASFILGQDIDASASGTSPMAPISDSAGVYMIGMGFQGTVFDGAGFKISHLSVQAVDDEGIAGLFGIVQGMIFKNVHLEDVKINGYLAAGALAGIAINTNIAKCSSTGTVIASSINPLSPWIISDETMAGGLFGAAINVNISKSYSSAVVQGATAGGLVGFQQDLSTITNSYANGTVKAFIGGGIVGSVDRSFANGVTAVKNSFASEALLPLYSALSTDIRGGLVGTLGSTLTNSFSVSAPLMTSGANGGITGAVFNGSYLDSQFPSLISHIDPMSLPINYMGTYDPGLAESTGMISILGNYTQSSTGTLGIVMTPTPAPTYTATPALFYGYASNSKWDSSSSFPQVSCAKSTGSTNCGTLSGVTNNASYFMKKANAPLSSWDFISTWVENPFDYPTLILPRRTHLKSVNRSTRLLNGWEVNDTQFLQSAYYTTSSGSYAYMPSGRTPSGTADMDGDGLDDLIWFNPTTSEVSFSSLNGTILASTEKYITLTDGITHFKSTAGLIPYGIGDMDGDKKPDLIFFNPSTRQITFYRIVSGKFYSSTLLSTAVPAGLTLFGIADLDRDRINDFVFFNSGTQQVSYARKSGTNLYFSSPLTLTTGVACTASAGDTAFDIQDLDGDGKKDLIFLNTTSRKLTYWKLNGTKVTSKNFILKSDGTAFLAPSGFTPVKP